MAVVGSFILSEYLNISYEGGDVSFLDWLVFIKLESELSVCLMVWIHYDGKRVVSLLDWLVFINIGK